MTTLRVSIITVVRNAAATLEQTILSVAAQDHDPIEHIVIDGGSTDGTLEIIRRHQAGIDRWISEPDRGIYDAMNKGVALAGGDIVAFLNGDDIYAHERVITEVCGQFERHDVDACYGDLVYVEPDDPDKVVRYYACADFTPERIPLGWMPAHPALFVKRRVFQEYGAFETDYRIAGDFEFVARVFGRHHIRSVHLPRVLVRMRTGGVSTRSWRSNVLLNREIVRACRDNGIDTNLFRVYLKYPRKLLELVRRPARTGAP